MKALILAAGVGRSLYPLTRERPKSLLEINGVTILERLLTQTTSRGLSPLVVVGYQKEKVIAELRRLQPRLPARVEVVENARFQQTNTLASLGLALRRAQGEDVLVLDGDLVCEDRVVDRLLADRRPVLLAVDTARVMGEEEVKVVCAEDGRVVDIGKTLPAASAHAEFIGMAKYAAGAGAELARHVEQVLDEGNDSAYYEEAVARLAGAGTVDTLDVAGLTWFEIDFLADLVDALQAFGDLEAARALSAMAERRQILFCPGPVLLSRGVKRALAAPEIGHRETEFSELLNRVRLKLGRVFGVRNFHRYTTVVLTGSASAANEALLGSAAAGRRLLVLSNGEFGERLARIAAHVGAGVVALAARWGQPFDLAAVEERIAAARPDAVAWVHHETSTGMLNPVAEIAAAARRHGVDTYLDAVSSVGGVAVDVEAHGLTFCTGGANKALGAPPGLAFVCGRRDAFEALASCRPASLYLDLHNHFHHNDRLHQTPNTPAVPLFFALDAALDEVLAEGLERRFARHRRLGRRLRRGLARLGLRPFLPGALMSPLLTTVELPPGFSAEEVHDRLKSAGYIVYTGKGILHDRVFQIATLGALRPAHVDGLLGALEDLIGERRDHTRHHPGRRNGHATAPADRPVPQGARPAG